MFNSLVSRHHPYNFFINSNAQKGLIKSQPDQVSKEQFYQLSISLLPETATKVITIINALNSLLRIKAFLSFIFCGFLNI